MNVCTYTCTCIDPFIQTFIHIQVHIHTNVHIHVHILPYNILYDTTFIPRVVDGFLGGIGWRASPRPQVCRECGDAALRRPYCNPRYPIPIPASPSPWQSPSPSPFQLMKSEGMGSLSRRYSRGFGEWHTPRPKPIGLISGGYSQPPLSPQPPQAPPRRRSLRSYCRCAPQHFGEYREAKACVYGSSVTITAQSSPLLWGSEGGSLP